MKHLVTLLCLIAAIVLYAAGSVTGATVLILASAGLEGVFWLRLFKRNLSSAP